MRTSSDCFACFMEQAARGAWQIAPDDTALRERLVRQMAELLAGADLDRPPPDLEAEKGAPWGRDAYPAFRGRIAPGAKVLILGDNAGEIGLDTLLVKKLASLGAEVAYAVRETPVLNDATMEDAEIVGLTRLCRVLSSGSDAPGAVLGRLNPQTRRLMDEADVLLSKGQGNFESLEGRMGNVFFALKAKCRAVALALDVPQGSSVFVHYE